MAETAVPSGFREGSGSSEDRAAKFLEQIQEIGLARFIGRINAGVIPTEEGYQAIELFVSKERRRPLISTIARALAGRQGS